MKIAFAVTIFLTTVLAICLLESLSAPKPPLYIEQISPHLIQPDNGILTVIKKLNARNARIKSITCLGVQIKVNNLFFQLKSTILFEKERNFRMIVKSLAGKELDIGSNQSQFWFWSKRMNPSALHYADYRDLHKTRLKTPFHPFLLMDLFGVSELNVSQSQLYLDREHLILQETRTSTMNTPITKRTLIDTKLGLIRGHYLYENGVLVASAEIIKFNGGLPSEAIITWYEENIIMLWTLDKVMVNQTIDPSYWKLPNYRRKIDMGKN